MHKKITKKQKEISLTMKTALGLIIPSVVGTIVAIIVSFIFAYVLSKSPVISKFSIIYFISSIVIGGLICGYISTKMLSFKGLISGLLGGIPLSIFVFIIMLFFSNGQLNEWSIIILVLVLFSSTIGGIISANMKRRK